MASKPRTGFMCDEAADKSNMTLQKITGLAAAVTLAGSLAMPATGLAHASAGHQRHHRQGHAARHSHTTHHSRRIHRAHHEHAAPMAHIALMHGAR